MRVDHTVIASKSVVAFRRRLFGAFQDLPADCDESSAARRISRPSRVGKHHASEALPSSWTPPLATGRDYPGRRGPGQSEANCSWFHSHTDTRRPRDRGGAKCRAPASSSFRHSRLALSDCGCGCRDLSWFSNCSGPKYHHANHHGSRAGVVDGWSRWPGWRRSYNAAPHSRGRGSRR
jgi:hypothetical protein